ncbi:hypothetical protein QBK99_11015 [Corticibacterium sp. UT-5YL-CI-8]|nr:hypothetical protein [Tianweitania sp. UT-5YL-CI-8]
MVKYVFKDGPITIRGAKDADPQLIGEALASLSDAAGGELTPSAVVESAREPESPLHGHFDWNDAEAAEKWRVEQARTLIRCIRVDEVGSNQEPAPAFISISDTGGVSYRSVAEVRSSSDLQGKLLAAAERDLQAFTVRYRMLKDICAIVETARKVASSKRVKNETRAAA